MADTESPAPGRDRLRELLDAVLDEDNTTLGEMAEGAYSSAHHFSRRLTRDAGEPPVSMRRRVLMERAAWRLRRGASVTEVAFEAGHESVEGFGRAFSRAFGHVPSRTVDRDAGHWLPAPNGIHFHPPTSLWVDATAGATGSPNEVLAQLVAHDLDDTRDLLDALCDPPESFVVGSVVAHVLTFAAHRRQLARQLLRTLGHDVDHGDPIDWHRRRTGGRP